MKHHKEAHTQSGTYRFIQSCLNGIHACNRIVGKWLGACVLAMVLLSATNAIARKFFNFSSVGLFELQWYLFSTVFLLGAGYALQQHAHVRIDILSQRFSPRTKAIVDLLAYGLLVLPLLGFLLWHCSHFAYASMLINEHSPDPGGLVRWPVKLTMVLGFLLLALQVLADSAQQLRILLRRD